MAQSQVTGQASVLQGKQILDGGVQGGIPLSELRNPKEVTGRREF